MARYVGPVCKLCRREGMKLYLKGERCYSEKCAHTRRPPPPLRRLLSKDGSSRCVAAQFRHG